MLTDCLLRLSSTVRAKEFSRDREGTICNRMCGVSESKCSTFCLESATRGCLQQKPECCSSWLAEPVGFLIPN